MVMVFLPVARSPLCAEAMLATVEPVSTVMLLGAAVVSLPAPLLTVTAPSTLPPRTFRLPPVPSMVTLGALVLFFTSFRVTVLLTPFTVISPTELLVMVRLWAARVLSLSVPTPSSVMAAVVVTFVSETVWPVPLLVVATLELSVRPEPSKVTFFRSRRVSVSITSSMLMLPLPYLRYWLLFTVTLVSSTGFAGSTAVAFAFLMVALPPYTSRDRLGALTQSISWSPPITMTAPFRLPWTRFLLASKDAL